MEKYQLTCQRVFIKQGKKVYCTSDIHGGINLLSKLLNNVNYTSDDYLFILGDIIEKGNDSLATLRYVMNLAKNPNTYCLIGNNEYFVIDSIFERDFERVKRQLNKCNSIFNDFIDYLHIDINNIDSNLFFDQIINSFHEELMFMYNLPTIIETNNIIFAHAAIETEDLLSNDLHTVLSYNRFMDIDKRFSKRVVVGHYPSVAYQYEHCSLLPVTDYQKNITAIDGGFTAKIGGELNLLEFDSIDTLNEKYYYLDDLEKVEVLEDFDGTNCTILGIWEREKFEVLEKLDLKSKVLINDYETIIPSDFVLEYKGKYYCLDYTDEFLPLTRGQYVGIVIKYDDISFIKKGHTLGFAYNKNLKFTK